MATIHKRKLRSGRTVWVLTHGTGTDRQRFVAGKTREEAQEALQQFERQLVLHGEAPTDARLDAVLRQYLSYLSVHRRASTSRRYERVLKTFHACFLEPNYPQVVHLRQVKPMHVEEYKARRLNGSIAESESAEVQRRDATLRAELQAGSKAATPRANAKFGWLGRKRLRSTVTQRTVNYELRVLQTYFKWAVKRNHLLVDPAANVERFRLPKRALPRFMEAEDLKRFFAACRRGERRLFMAILMTGMRKGEVEHLTWDDIDFERGFVHIREKPEWNWRPKTDERIIPMSPALSSLLREQWADCHSKKLVFPNKEGNRDTHILQKFKKICRKAGLKPTTVHALRHSFGAHLRMAGVSLADIADLLGHKDLSTTQIYAKVHQEHLRRAVSQLSPLTAGADDGSQESPPRRESREKSGEEPTD